MSPVETPRPMKEWGKRILLPIQASRVFANTLGLSYDCSDFGLLSAFGDSAFGFCLLRLVWTADRSSADRLTSLAHLFLPEEPRVWERLSWRLQGIESLMLYSLAPVPASPGLQ